MVEEAINKVKKLKFLNFNLFLIAPLLLIIILLSYNFNTVFNRSKALSADIDNFKISSLKKQKVLSELLNTNSKIKGILFLHLLSEQNHIMDAYSDEYRKLFTQNNKLFNELNELLQNKEEKSLLRNLNRFRTRLASQREYFINLSLSGQKDEAKVYYSRSLYYAFSLYTTQLQNLSDHIDNSSMQYYDIIQSKTESNYKSIKNIIGAGIISVFILLVLVWRINRKLNTDNERLNELLINKEQAETSIKKLNETLEETVLQRTLDLESALTELNQQIAALNKSAIVTETDAKGNITFVNDMFCSISGYNKNELIGKNHKIIKSNKQPDSLFANMWSTITKGEIWKGLVQNKAKNGTYFWLNSTIMPFKNKEGEIVKYVAIRFDMTLQIEQQLVLQSQADELSAQSEELRVQQEELHEANIVLLSQTKKLQASEEELKTQHEKLLVTNNELHEKGRLIEERNAIVNQKNIELNIIHNELAKKAEQLELSSKYKSEFLANMSHELRTPLNSILLLSKLLSENGDENLTEDQIEYATVINNSGNGLLELINEILDLSKIEAGKMDLNKENIPVSYFCKSVNDIFNPLARNKGIEFKTIVDENTTKEIFTDRIRVEQVLKNLISNAMKFTEKGSVTLKVYKPSDSQIEKLKLPKHSYIAFEVIDSGIGIPANKLEHVFGAFQQADGSTQRKYGGTGLGLAISREIAHLLNGNIFLESEVGVGSKFTFIILSDNLTNLTVIENTPSESTEVTQPEKQIVPEPENIEIKQEKPNQDLKETELTVDYASGSQLDSKNILIVDDDVRNIFSLKALLKNHNVNITTAENGKQALEEMNKATDFDLVLMDMMMPEMDGYDMIKELRSVDKWKDLPVIAVTAKIMQGEKEKCFEAGVSDYLSKPIKGDQLISLLKIWLYK